MSRNYEASTDWRKIDFICDDEGSCALTVFLNGERLHIIADATNFAHETKLGKEYHDLVHCVQHSQSEDDGSNKDNGSNSDSGVDVGGIQEEATDGVDDGLDIEERLCRWMMCPVLKARKDASKREKSPATQTILDWYHCPTYFYDLKEPRSGKGAQAVELEATTDLRERMINLLPQATLPKYITDGLEAPCYNASDLLVLEASDQPPGTPCHPCRVEHQKSKKTYFLKIVDNTQPHATKREIQILSRIKELKLHESFNVPSLNGLVMFDDASQTPAGKKRIMGFLQTEITDPVPLTTMLRSEISQMKREKWAKEVQRVKGLLHENDIVWGDAKADNFMVDSNEDLWIIDFGGGYTVSWVEPELIETAEGDNMGTEKIVNALKDPEANVCDDSALPETEANEGRKSSKRKRKNDESLKDHGNKVRRC